MRTQAVASTLSAYLNDHLAGSKAAIEMVDGAAQENQGTPLGELMVRLKTEIDADRGTLEDLMGRLGVEPSPTKQAAGWMLEKLSRVRFNEKVTGSAATSRLMQLETLSLGIEGKRMLWNALQELGEADTRFDGLDFRGLVSRAESQRQAIDPFRLEAAAEGLAP